MSGRYGGKHHQTRGGVGRCSSGTTAGAPRYARDEEEAVFIAREHKRATSKNVKPPKPVSLPKFKCLEDEG